MRVFIKNIWDFGSVEFIRQVGVHQVLECDQDIDNAYRTAERSGFEIIVFYVKYPKNWMSNQDFRNLVKMARTGVCE
jgi:hydroxyacyl-ACP dehydratase HTD2-like protein with hotdog domain